MIRTHAVTTATKIRVARVLYRLASSVRKLSGTSGPLVVKRRGVWFELDLSEGIDLAIFFFGAFEPNTMNALVKLAPVGGAVLDIGANIGFHTLHLARAVGPAGHVYAFEPTDYARTKLRRNLSLNPTLAPRVTIVPSYLDDGQPQATEVKGFYSSWRLDTVRGQHPKHFGSLHGAAGATRLRLDTFLAEQHLKRVGLVKIDVDGFECRVLRGAPRLLEEMAPVFVMELCPYALEEHGGSLAELMGLLTTRGYAFYEEATFSPLPSNPAFLAHHIPRNSSINAVATTSMNPCR